VKRDVRAESFLILTTLIWGGTFAIIKGALADISPMLMVGIRFLLATVLSWPILIRNRRPTGKSENFQRFTPEAWLWGALIGFVMLVGYAGQTIGLKYTTVARSGFINYSFALFVPFLQFFFLGKKPDRGNLLGLVVVFSGLSFITGAVSGSILNGGINKGDLYSLLAALGYAFYIVLIDRAAKVIDPSVLTMMQMLFCGVFAMALVPFVETPVLVISWRLVVAMAYLVLFGSVLALALMNWFQRRITPLRAVLIYALEPVFAALIGWFAFHSGMSPAEILGAVLILGGIIVSDLWELLVRKFNGNNQKRSSGR
jgi:drug/metabolite transporter (DMT)-like permease